MIKEEELCFLLKITLLQFCFAEKTEIFCVELNLRKQICTAQKMKFSIKDFFSKCDQFRRLIFCCYNPQKHLIKDHLLHLKNAIDFYSKPYENVILIGDYNAEISDTHMNSFCAIYHLKSLINEPTCYKNPEKPTCLDLMLR